LELSVSGNVSPEIENPVPVIVAELTVTAPVPVEVSVTDCVAGEFRLTLPNAIVVAFTLRACVCVAAPSCNAKVSDTPFSQAVSVTVCAELTAVTVAENPTLFAPETTVTVDGTVTAELLLDSITRNPPLCAGELSVTVQLSVPALVIDAFVHVSPDSTGSAVPVPLRLTTVVEPADELLARVSVPVTAPAVVGSNCTVSVAL
jgi:hypothetical protein